MSQKTAAIAVVALALSALTACSNGGGQGTERPDGDTTPDVQEDVTITYGIWDDTFRPTYEEILVDFREQYPHITVKFEVTSFADYFTKLQTSISSGNEPDVFWLQHNSFPLYAENDALAPLDTDDVDLSGYPQGTLDQFTIDGELYGYPWSTPTVGLWYNTDLFDAAGIDYPDETWTWDDVREAAATLTDPSNGVYGIVAPLHGQEGYYNTIFQAGGEIIRADGTSGFDSPEAIEGVQFWVDFVEAGHSPNLQQTTDTERQAWFTSSKAAMFYGGSWRASTFASTPEIADHVDVAPLPVGRTNTVAFATGVNVVSAGSRNLEAAGAWAEFLTSDEAQQAQAASGVVVPASRNARDAWVESLPEFNVAVFIDQVEDAEPLPSSLNTNAWESQLVEYLAPAWNGAESVAEACGRVAEMIDQALADER